jgi:adenylosuccinate lyase
MKPIHAISPIDGRYRNKTLALADYFSEYALIKYRIWVEIEYFIALGHLPDLPLAPIAHNAQLAEQLRDIYRCFSVEAAERVKEIEKTTNHDVKAVEYYIKEQLNNMGLAQYAEWVHFGLTSQDINNTAIPLSLQHFYTQHYEPQLETLCKQLATFSHAWQAVPMLSRTHGQAASPTLLGKEIAVFLARIEAQKKALQQVPYSAKFGGAVGNFNAHFVAYPHIDWHQFAQQLTANLGLSRSFPTTQIEHYDNIAALCHAYSRINTILIDLCRDIWSYISMDYFKQKIVANEVGSSAMPHKVNPIDFENAEGNLGIANAIFEHLAAKLPISRLQRDLTDSTVLRNIGVPLAHTTIAIDSLLKGLGKLLLNEQAIQRDLAAHWEVIAEAIQTILRRENFPQPYEALKNLTRQHAHITETVLHQFIDQLTINEQVKQELKNITPFNYTGK